MRVGCEFSHICAMSFWWKILNIIRFMAASKVLGEETVNGGDTTTQSAGGKQDGN